MGRNVDLMIFVVHVLSTIPGALQRGVHFVLLELGFQILKGEFVLLNTVALHDEDVLLGVDFRYSQMVPYVEQFVGSYVVPCE